MKANTDKCHLLTTANEERGISIWGEKMQKSKSERLLGVAVPLTGSSIIELQIIDHIEVINEH